MRKLAIVSAALSAAVAASAQEFKRVDGLVPARVEFDAEDGRYQHWDAEVGCKANALRALITFRRIGKPTTKWAPTVAVGLQHGDEMANNGFVKFSIFAPEFKPTFRADLIAAKAGPDENIEQTMEVRNYAASFDGTRAIPFSMTWTADGEVAASVGGEVQRVSLHGPIDYVVIAGSSGAGVLDPLEIGVIGDPATAVSCKPLASAKDGASPGSRLPR